MTHRSTFTMALLALIGIGCGTPLYLEHPDGRDASPSLDSGSDGNDSGPDDGPRGGSGMGGAIGTGGAIGIGGATGTGGAPGSGGAAGTGGVIGTGGVLGTGGATCTNVCTEGTTKCLSDTTLQTCSLGGNGCTSFISSTCSTGLVCERYAPADCVDPNWAEWPMPNSYADVTAGAPNLENYTDNGDGTVTDGVTGLMWQKTVSTTAVSQPGALAYCATTLNSAVPALGGYTDWRLPSFIELLSLVDDEAPSPSINPAFPETPATYFWSSSLVAGSPAYAWLVNFSNGSSSNLALANMVDVRCVR